ncbi:hypothetical protein SAMN05443247_11736 [Bradyrhizobium erythrophlei]|nr:hypothetical protein SAMN05443247_11736 [Bradyrhizobium erythrophlei]
MLQLGYPHWLIIAGAVLLVIGFIGLAFHRSGGVEPNDEPTRMKANGNVTGESRTSPPFPLGHGTCQVLEA